MIVRFLVAALCAVLFASNADARPKHHHRHHIRVVDDSQHIRGRIHRKSLRHRHFLSSTTSKRIMPPGLRRVMAEGAGRIVAHPRGCPRRAFCGCGAAVRIFGKPIRSLWRAANWFRFPRTSPAPGMVAVRRHHVFVLLRHVRGRVWRVYDANSGRHRTRVHRRSIAGWTIVDPRGGS